MVQLFTDVEINATDGSKQSVKVDAQTGKDCKSMNLKMIKMK